MPNINLLHVYSSGAVAPPIKKCGEEFKIESGTEFEFTVGKAENLISEIAESRKGDILTCGAEFILDDAQERELIFGDTRKSVGYRKSAILVPMACMHAIPFPISSLYSTIECIFKSRLGDDYNGR